MYYHQIPKGGNYNTLKKCVTINILNYSTLPNDRYHSVFHLREDRTGVPLLDDIEIHIIELTKLNEHAAELEEGGLVNWLLFLKGVDKSNWEVLTMKEPMLKKAMDTLEFLSQDRAARMAYDARMKALSDEKSRIEGAKTETSKEIAVRLLNRGVDLQTVSEATGLSMEEVKLLRQ